MKLLYTTSPSYIRCIKVRLLIYSFVCSYSFLVFLFTPIF